jgi:hypothetical protein
MRRLYKTLRIAILSLVVFSALSVASESYAYWASSITGNNAVDTATVTMGTWQTIPQWDPAGTYLTGDQVVNNGFIYQAKKDNPTKQPGVDNGWTSQWTEIGPA